MIIIIDDTFKDRFKFNDVQYLEEERYKNVCSIKTIIKTIEIEEIEEIIKKSKILCFHKTLQLYDVNGHPLKSDSNDLSRRALINNSLKLNISHIEFSRRLGNNILVNQIDKDLFYKNLRDFLDYYIDHNLIEKKILYYGKRFRENEKMTIIQNTLVAIRITPLNEFSSNFIIKQGLELLYPNENVVEVINQWINKNLTKEEIIKQINNKIL